ncbi:helix-turn-helix domain-containing protein [Aestuariirhabdus sp. Z084]|uniref:GlxA family transcriptional regulator n=1 Tax=Aestuariirhabdus haliotis TaxID=2918751 RepID=UPI00201B3BB7|nr:helix-turn-helix domain-containing protein [Aestuariirhabdus haliotis]MCL6417616.1 helix-turn-helix domain-containing protein [Aestuariirhabdus haliotis]MCL6421542.1 helix-turn-helix domain-containing protein [Aestuariirhabdus haliotis]
MVSVTVLVFDYALAAAVMGISDLLYFAGNAYQRARKTEGAGRFRVRLASRDGKPVKAMNRMTITPHCAIADIESSDIYLVPTITGDIEQTLKDNPWVVQQLQQAAGTDAIIGSNSNGSFFLAEAGLLDDKKATTFWDNVALFRRRYPSVDLRPDQLLIHDGNILSDAGGTSWFDLGLYLVELFCDHQTAMEAAKYFMVDLERSTQLSFTPLTSKKYHSDALILQIQGWMEQRYAQAFSMATLSDHFGLSNRTFVRRFKQATGVTPLNYLQEVRLNAASRLLVQSHQSIEVITHSVGYEDISSFTRMFKRRTGYSPSGYRSRFRAVHVAG